jgi:choline dehydrogenase
MHANRAEPPSETFDYVIVGAGSSGCVLANRLSADPKARVLLIEAGPPDSSFLYRIPKGFGKILATPSMIWHHEAEGDEGNAGRRAIWHRGKTLGGSSSINGMVYMRGHPRDYDDWAAGGCDGWGWQDMSRCFRSIEHHALGDDGTRGSGGPLYVTPHPGRDPVCDAVIEAGVRLGLDQRSDINRDEHEGIAYVTRTIADGRRMSSARAFLDPVRKRSNLRILTDMRVDRVRFDGAKAVGVEGVHEGRTVSFGASREIVLSAGAIGSPLILQRSGIGSAALLRDLQIPVLSDLPGVGQNLREHYLLMMNFRLRGHWGLNREFQGIRLWTNLLKWQVFRKGVMANGSHDVCAFIRSRPGVDRPDAEILMAPWSLGTTGLESEPGLHLFAYVLRPQTSGFLQVRSPDVETPPLIQPRYLGAESDRATAVASLRFIRRMTETEPLRSIVACETRPGQQVQTDDEILTAYRELGQIAHHAAGTCKMGPSGDPMAVVDSRLRVRGTSGLRVMDISVMPTLVSGNTNGPAMAMAWRAAEMIRADHK